MSCDTGSNAAGPPAYVKQLRLALDGALTQYGASFACCGQLHRGDVGPKIQVQGVGNLTYPLTRELAAALQEVCQQAPYGRGEATVVDTNVRDTLHLDPAGCTITNAAEWNHRVSHILTDVCVSLGVPRPAAEVSAELHKLLLYKPGSFFKRHRDSEKVPGMFGTLVVCLPAAYSGGQLLVHHRGSSKRYGSGELPPDCVTYVAFYADCEHEVKRITAGHRLCLTYNLCYRQPGAAAAGAIAAGDPSAVADAAAAMKAWVAHAGGPEMLFYLLEHLYTSESRVGLSAAALKGADAAQAGVAAAAGAQSGVELALVRMTRMEGGEARGSSWDEEMDEEQDEEDNDEYDSDYDSAAVGVRIRQGQEYLSSSSGSDHGMEDIYEVEHTASEWVLFGGGVLGFKDIAVHEELLLQDQQYWRHIQPCMRQAGGYTGNEGCPMSLWYSQTAVAMWRQRDTVMMQLRGTGFSTLLHYLRLLVDRLHDLQQKQQEQQQQSNPEGAAAAEAGRSISVAAPPAFVPALDGERQLLLPDVSMFTTAVEAYAAAEQIAAALVAHHEKGGAMSSTKLAKLLTLLQEFNNPWLLEAFFTGPLAAAAAYATSHLKSRVADNNCSVLCNTTATGRHFAWADLAPALLLCCVRVRWERVKQVLLPIVKEYLVAVRNKRWPPKEDQWVPVYRQTHRNPLAFEAAYGQVLSLVLQFAGQQLRSSTVQALSLHCPHIPEKPKVPQNIAEQGTDELLGEFEEEQDEGSRLKEEQASKAAIESAAATAAAATLLPSSGALQDLHSAVQADLGPGEASQVLAGLPGWQLEVCKDTLNLLLEMMLLEEAATEPPDMFDRGEVWGEVSILHTPRDAGLLLSLLQAVYLLADQGQLGQLVQHITRQPRVYDVRATVAPAALEFCQWLGDVRLSGSAAAVQLLQSCLVALQQLTAQGPPDASREQWRVDTDHLRLCLTGSCRKGDVGCRDCNALMAFLSDGRQQTWRFRASRERRDHIRMVVPPYFTWQQEQINKHRSAQMPGDEVNLAAEAECNVKIISDEDDSESKHPETVNRAERAAAAVVRAAEKRRGKSSSSAACKDAGPSEYVPGKRAAGMTAAKKAAMAQIGELTVQKVNRHFQECVQHYQDNMLLLGALRAIATRAAISTPASAAAELSLLTAAEAGAGWCSAVRQVADMPTVKADQAEALAGGHCVPEKQSMDNDNEPSVVCSAAAAGAGAGSSAGVPRGGQTAVRTRGRSQGSGTILKHSRSPQVAATPRLSRSRTAARKK